jgi:hypothetical protein
MERRRDPIRVTIEIERGVEPLAGGVDDGSGSPRTFVGWMGLAAVLTRILDEAARADGEQL